MKAPKLLFRRVSFNRSQRIIGLEKSFVTAQTDLKVHSALKHVFDESFHRNLDAHLEDSLHSDAELIIARKIQEESDELILSRV